ncbi:MAG: hypothetical protein ABH879_07155 [archaeon]
MARNWKRWIGNVSEATNNGHLVTSRFIIVSCLILGALLLYLLPVIAEPIGPVVSPVGNSTKVTPTNESRNESQGGGYIYTINLAGDEQNPRWKAYVGNVSGSLKLDDADGFTFYNWDLGTLTGEVYATRSSSVINWSGMNCTWGWTTNNTNRTAEIYENTALSHTRLDNITATFSGTTHPEFDVGTATIDANSCYAFLPYVNDSSQTATQLFAETILYDGTNATNGNIVYATQVEDTVYGYRNGSMYDFQLIVPEVGTYTWTRSTAYYFYVELE